MALAIKEVGKSGQISIGKALVGTRFEIVQQANGDMLLKRVQVVAASEAWAHTPEMKKKLDAAQADIVAGRIKVADYMADNACRY